MQLLGDGQVTNLQISASCPWTISVSANWLSVTPTSGTGSQTVTVSVGKNPTGAERSTTLNIRGGGAPARSVVVTQLRGSEDARLSADVSTMSFEAKGESKQINVNSNTNWTVTKPEWCSLSVASSSGNGTITVTAQENQTNQQRTGQIVISGDNVSSIIIAVSQKAKDSTNTEIPGPNDNLPPQ